MCINTDIFLSVADQSANNDQLKDNLIYQLKTNLTLGKDQLDSLETRINNLTLEKNDLKTINDHVTLERDQLKHDVNQLKKEAETKGESLDRMSF